MLKKKFFAWIPCMSIMLLIFYFSSRNGIQSNIQSDSILDNIIPFLSNLALPRIIYSFIIRKLGHLTEYFLLSLSVWYALSVNKSKNTFILTLTICYFYAVTDEIHQYFVPGRSAEFRDTLIDLVGILLGILFSIALTKLRRHKKEKGKTTD